MGYLINGSLNYYIGITLAYKNTLKKPIAIFCKRIIFYLWKAIMLPYARYKMLTLCNAFSLSMVPTDLTSVTHLQLNSLSLEEAKGFLSKGFVSYVGHPDTAKILENMLGLVVTVNRSSFSAKDAVMIVAQYIGPRLPEGTTILPEGSKIDFKLVTWGII